jgi:hypothetical protein
VKEKHPEFTAVLWSTVWALWFTVLTAGLAGLGALLLNGCSTAQLDAADPRVPEPHACSADRMRPDGVCCPTPTPVPGGPDSEGYYCAARYFTPEDADQGVLNPW